MTIDQNQAAEILAASIARRDERRRFIKLAGGGVAVAGGLSLLAACGGGASSPTPSPSPTPTPTSSASSVSAEVSVLNFALQLEYLEAQFYSYAATGAGLSSDLLSGTGNQGTVTGGRQVTFTDPIVASYAREIAADERAHVAFLRSVLGASAVAMPSINIDGSAGGAFAQAAAAAGLVASGQPFDPYASDENFLLGAFIFEDVGVTAYKGAASSLIYTAGYQEATAGLLAAEAYHAGLIRTTLYQKGIATPSLKLIESANAISNARDAIDGTAASTTAVQQDDDQGITDASNNANITPADGNGLAYSRTVGHVLNIAFLTKDAATKGGFYPSGVNGTLTSSTPN